MMCLNSTLPYPAEECAYGRFCLNRATKYCEPLSFSNNNIGREKDTGYCIEENVEIAVICTDYFCLENDRCIYLTSLKENSKLLIIILKKIIYFFTFSYS